MSKARELGFDTERVTLGDGSVVVDGMKVAGSRSFVRDPRLSPLAAALADLPPLWTPERQMMQIPHDSKWCSVCGDVRPKSYFSPDKRNYDGLDHRCKGCENERKRKGYQQRVGREVRVYTRRERAAGEFLPEVLPDAREA